MDRLAEKIEDQLEQLEAHFWAKYGPYNEDFEHNLWAFIEEVRDADKRLVSLGRIASYIRLGIKDQV